MRRQLLLTPSLSLSLCRTCWSCSSWPFEGRFCYIDALCWVAGTQFSSSCSYCWMRVTQTLDYNVHSIRSFCLLLNGVLAASVIPFCLPFMSCPGYAGNWSHPFTTCLLVLLLNLFIIIGIKGIRNCLLYSQSSVRQSMSACLPVCLASLFASHSVSLERASLLSLLESFVSTVSAIVAN